MLQDSFNRTHDYLRISLTDNCNFRCLYCIPNENVSFMVKEKLMQAEEIYTIAKNFVDLGVTKIRLTGGEPLVRHDFQVIIKKLSTLPIQLHITTNGLLLDKYYDTLAECGITSLNVSLDSLNEDNFKSITKRDSLKKVWNNILLGIEKGFYFKLNVVVMKGINDHEIMDFVNLTENLPIHVRFIEFMPFDKNNWNKDKVISNQLVISDLKENYPLFKLSDDVNDTTKKYGITDHKGTISFISTLTDSFCGNCNRMRLTADGKMKNCLFGNDEVNLLQALRQDEELSPLIKKCVFNKHKKLGGQFEDYKKINPNKLQNRSMIAIGG